MTPRALAPVPASAHTRYRVAEVLVTLHTCAIPQPGAQMCMRSGMRCKVTALLCKVSCICMCITQAVKSDPFANVCGGFPPVNGVKLPALGNLQRNKVPTWKASKSLHFVM